MKAHEAACSIKVAILICDRDREWKSGYCWKKRPFFYFLTRLAASPFAIPLQAKTEHVAVSSHQLNSEIKQITWIRMFCERLAAFIPVLRRQYLWTWPPDPTPLPPRCTYSPWSESTNWAPRERSIFRMCYPCHISVRCGSPSSWNNEAMFND